MEPKEPVEEIVGEEGWGESRQDVLDMQRLGKKQELKVRPLMDSILMPKADFGFLAA